MIPTMMIEAGNTMPEGSGVPASKSSLYRQRSTLPTSQTRLLLVVVAQIWQNLVAHRLRTILTSVGIIIGIGAIYAILVIGDTGKVYTRTLLLPFHVGTIAIRPLSPHASANNATLSRTVIGEQRYINTGDALFLKNAYSGRAALSPVCEVASNRISCEGFKIQSCRVIAVTGDYEVIGKLSLVAGRYILPTDTQTAVVAVDDIGRFHGLPFPVLGRIIVIDGATFKVVGLVKNSVGINNAPDIMIPFLPEVHTNIGRMLLYSATDREERALEQIRALIASRNSGSIAAQLAEADEAGIMSVFLSIVRLLALISAISLAVGCVGVMNTLIASVEEKTFEVGVRSALGAGPVLIFFHFLGEALLLCAAAGISGMLAGAGAVTVVSMIHNMSPVFLPGPILIAFGSAIAIGFVGGLLPALQAARLNPWDALRKGTS
jgi:putative ABC transport system permease protein